MKHLHYKLYKPFGMLSQLYSNDARQNRKKRFLTELRDFPDGIMPIGRLDEKSEGLLLMTTDGKISYAINRNGVEKEYYAQLDGEISDEAIALLSNGIDIGLQGTTYATRPCVTHRLSANPQLPEPNATLRLGRHRPTSWISIALTEGKFRQVRKMTAAVGYPTLRLVRVRVGTISIDNLVPREVKMVTQTQIDAVVQSI
ncbi:23S rRNA pseudouridine2457 synthase [Pricia antarctica]|uniref:Pseudouridine synthase n=1 Tax=Pricia antarctica TaxID=641691 RepID=A0A1G7BXX0_9FLAO|nr:pseudouridine synthase [Pricia antarctica]SDE31852.1 23S rRNA pseudouridine2457 synthase [Pricia antarctica]